MVSNIIIEEAPCKKPILSSGEVAAAEILHGSTGQNIIRLCQGPAGDSLAANLKADAKFLDGLSLKLFDSLLEDISRGAQKL